MECLRIPLLDVDVYFGNSVEDASGFIRSRAEGEEAVTQGCRGLCYTVTDAQGRNHRMMCVFDGELGTVAHEAAHMARITLKHAGVKHSANDDEIFALTVEWLVKAFLRVFRVEVVTE